MSKVKTYAVNCNDAWLNTDGDDISESYVKYADYMVLATKLELAERACSALAAENAWLNKFIVQSCYVFDGEQGEPSDAYICAIDGMMPQTPATDAFLDEVRVSAIPEGYVLVPQQIFLEPSDIESICSQCGDGHESWYGDFTDGMLWVGNIQRDDGSIVHGLHISSADYSEEGGVTVCEFAAQLRKEGNQ